MPPVDVLRARSTRLRPRLNGGARRIAESRRWLPSCIPSAAIALADELAETKEKLQRLEPELAGLQDASVISSDRAQATQAAIAAALNAAAERIESVTRMLNETVPVRGVPLG